MNNNMTSTERFEKIYRLTEAICKISPSISLNYNHIHDLKDERWKVLAHIWRDNKEKFDSNIFLNALGMIFYGCHVSYIKNSIEKLVEEVTNAILYDEYALMAWCDTLEFDKVFDLFSRKSDPRFFFEDYQISQAILRIFYYKYINGSKETQNKINSIAERYSFNFNDCKFAYGGFKMMIKAILPQSMEWDDQRWCNEAYIFSEINDKYNSQIYDVNDDISAIFDLVSYRPGSEINFTIFFPRHRFLPNLSKPFIKLLPTALYMRFFAV